MVLGRDVDLETSSLISELNSAIAFLSLKDAVALFSSEMSAQGCFQVHISSQGHDVCASRNEAISLLIGANS